MKSFAEDMINLAEKLKPVLGRVENIVGKGENAGNQHFLLFPQCFQKPSLSGPLKVGILWKIVNPKPYDRILDLSKFKAFADYKLNEI